MILAIYILKIAITEITFLMRTTVTNDNDAFLGVCAHSNLRWHLDFSLFHHFWNHYYCRCGNHHSHLHHLNFLFLILKNVYIW